MNPHVHNKNAMSEYEIVDTAPDTICACDFCGYKAGKTSGHQLKYGRHRGNQLGSLLLQCCLEDDGTGTLSGPSGYAYKNLTTIKFQWE